MTRKYSSISVETTLANGISSTATSMTVATGTGSTLMGGVTLAAGNVDQFTVALDVDTQNEEIVFVTAVNGDTLTIVRARAGSSGITHSGGATVKHVLTSDDLTFYTTGVATANAAVPSATVTAKADILVGLSSGVVDNLPVGTNGQVLTADSTQTLGLTWSAAATGDVTLTGTQTLTNKTLTSPFLTTPSISNIDAAGDLLYGTADNTLGKLSIGTAGQVLTVNSGATAPQWSASGGMTQLATGSLSGAGINITSIPATYSDLRLIIRNYLPATDDAELLMRFNADSGSNRYLGLQDATYEATTAFSATRFNLTVGNDNAVTQSLVYVDILDYTNTSTWKIANITAVTNDSTTTTSVRSWRARGIYNQTTAISQINLLTSSGNFTSGTYIVYGVK